MGVSGRAENEFETNPGRGGGGNRLAKAAASSAAGPSRLIHAACVIFIQLNSCLDSTNSDTLKAPFRLLTSCSVQPDDFHKPGRWPVV